MDAPLKPSTSRNESRLLDQIREVIRRFHYSIRTEKAYIDWIPLLLSTNRIVRFLKPGEVGGVEPVVTSPDRPIAADLRDGLDSVLFEPALSIVIGQLAWAVKDRQIG